MFPNAWTVQPEARNKLSADQAEDLSIVGKTTRLLFGKDFFPINGDLKNATAGGNQFNLYIRTKGGLQFFLQPGGTGFIVSLCAVFNGNLHGCILNVKQN